MATTPRCELEKLPLLVLERICDYLDNNSEDANRAALWAFSLTSRSCFAAAAPHLFRQIQLHAPDKDALHRSLEQWTTTLGQSGFYRYVRRLKITDQAKKKKMSDEWVELKDRILDDDHFYQPFGGRPNRLKVSQPIHEDDSLWVQLTDFIDKLSGLRDLAWAYSAYFPSSVLSSVHQRGCRLHMESFLPKSLVQDRNNPTAVHPDDYALISSPSLYSISAVVRYPPSIDHIYPIEEAVRRMVAGTSPNLTRVKLLAWTGRVNYFDGMNGGQQASRPWGGFFPGETTDSDAVTTKGNLRSLSFPAVSMPDLREWSEVTDLTKLHSLTLPWSAGFRGMPGFTAELADLASQQLFSSLKSLSLHRIDDNPDWGQPALRKLIENLPPLVQLSLEGDMACTTLQAVIERHGKSLRQFSVAQNRSPWRSPRVTTAPRVPTTHMIEQMADVCQNLEELNMGISRTHGDEREIAIYRALSRFPRLRRAFLRLEYTIGPDRNTWNDEVDGPHPLADAVSLDDVPTEYVRDAFVNGALDEGLARSIFDIISPPGSSPKTVYLQTKQDFGHGLVQTRRGNARFMLAELLRWVNPTWLMKRSRTGAVDVKEVDTDSSRSDAGITWELLAEMAPDDVPDVLSQERLRLLKEMCDPEATERWWETWKSLPLSTLAADARF
ncbi:hypothetical protein QBC34DRAFT_143859 [Podospora aff. communis PSN243]|uniref:F-box domain-containing protein n=1 Tax=Podospora aff. communis PSN243 TaxID=3040156 RepID=A0AAV9GFA2_9PEZI|nr:hypothetical protein QBC34DRAFT_143859 [Podospora aff. communis PSN243]